METFVDQCSETTTILNIDASQKAFETIGDSDFARFETKTRNLK